MTKQAKSLHGTLRDESSRLVQRAVTASVRGDVSTKSDAEIRRRCLLNFEDRLLKTQDEVRAPSGTKSMFISYARQAESPYFFAARAAAEHLGFQVVTGFDKSVQEKENILSAVIDAIRGASTFLCIMTPQYRITELHRDRRERMAPNVWLIEEKGMALAMGKPFRLLVHNSVHSDFWKKTSPGKLHHIFSEGTFQEHVKRAIHALAQRYNELERQR